MPLYEHVLLARQDITSQQVESLVQKVDETIKKNGGQVRKTELWGLRSLAYKIKKYRKAHYALLDIDAPPAAVFEMERQLRLNENVIRFLTVRVEKHEEGPSVVMQKRERDEQRRKERELRELSGQQRNQAFPNAGEAEAGPKMAEDTEDVKSSEAGQTASESVQTEQNTVKAENDAALESNEAQTENAESVYVEVESATVEGDLMKNEEDAGSPTDNNQKGDKDV